MKHMDYTYSYYEISHSDIDSDINIDKRRNIIYNPLHRPLKAEDAALLAANEVLSKLPKERFDRHKCGYYAARQLNEYPDTITIFDTCNSNNGIEFELKVSLKRKD